MNQDRPIPPFALELLKKHEGCRLEAYLCPGGVWTIGYGHTSQAVDPGTKIDQWEADRLLEADAQTAARAIKDMVKVPLNDNQFAALISFVFNIGAGAFRRSTLLRKLNAGDYAAVPAELARWNKGGGKVLPGLVKRRADEINLWRSA